MRSQPVFVAGATRSGTRWLSRSLAWHPSVVALRETQVLRYFPAPLPDHCAAVRHGSLWRKLRNVRRDHAAFPPVFDWDPTGDHPLTVPTPAIMVSRLLRLQDEFWRYQSWDDVAVEMFRILDGLRPVLVERTADHVFHLHRIRRNFPKARLVLTVRDGRDLLASARDVFGDRHPGKTQVRAAAQHWSQVCHAVESAKQAWPKEVLIVRHEDLRQRFGEEIERLFAFIGLETSPELLHLIEAGHGNRSDRFVTDLQRGPALSRDEINAFESIAGAHLEALGYAVGQPV